VRQELRQELRFARGARKISRFPTGSHLASSARVCPSNDESAGKRRSSHIGPGNPWLRVALVEAA